MCPAFEDPQRNKWKACTATGYAQTIQLDNSIKKKKRKKKRAFSFG